MTSRPHAACSQQPGVGSLCQAPTRSTLKSASPNLAPRRHADKCLDGPFSGLLHERIESRDCRLGVRAPPKPARRRGHELNFRESRAGLSPEPVEPSTRGAREPLVPVPRHQPTYPQGIGEPELQIGGVGDVYIAEQLGHTDPRFS